MVALEPLRRYALAPVRRLRLDWPQGSIVAHLGATLRPDMSTLQIGVRVSRVLWALYFATAIPGFYLVQQDGRVESLAGGALCLIAGMALVKT